jgi:hypothetical protein
MLLAMFDNPTTLLLIAMAVAAGILLMRSNRYFSSLRQSDTSSRCRKPAAQPPRYADVPDDVVRWEVEMHDQAREVMAQLDSKMSALQALIAEADRAAARLEAALAQSGRLPPQTPAAGEGHQEGDKAVSE